MVKQCTKCKLVKYASLFNKDKRKKDGLCSHCKQCQASRKERNNANRRKYYYKHREKILSKFKLNYAKDPLSAKDRDLRKIYGITLKQYEEMLLEQKQSCAVCETHKDSFSKALAVDHCHKTNKIRGLLCTNCNRAVGNLKDSIDVANKLIKYLEKHV